MTTREDGTLKYIHLDSLGSTPVMSTSAGTLDSSISYFPFGANMTGSAILTIVSKGENFTPQTI
jgi:hypothetical protein